MYREGWHEGYKGARRISGVFGAKNWRRLRLRLKRGDPKVACGNNSGRFTAKRAPKCTPQELGYALAHCMHRIFYQNVQGMSADRLMAAQKLDEAKYKNVSTETNKNQCRVYVCRV